MILDEQEVWKQCIDKFFEASRLRMTMGVALGVALISLTGYALQTNRHEVLLGAAIMPILILFIDLGLKSIYAAPFLYKALAIEFARPQSERLMFVFLSLGSDPHRYAEVFAIEAEVERQRLFRRRYMSRALWLKTLILSLLSIGELVLYFALAGK